MDRKPDFTDEDVGMQAFHLRRGQAVEKAIARIRQGLGNAFFKLSHDEVELLEWLLGEMWSMVGFFEWEELKFSLVTFEDVEKLLAEARKVMAHEKLGVEAFTDAIEIVRKAGERAEKA